MKNRTSKPAGFVEAASMAVGTWVGVTASLGKRITRVGLDSTATLGGLFRRPTDKPVMINPRLNATPAECLPETPCSADILSEPDEPQQEVGHTTSQADEMAAEIAQLQSELAHARHQAEETRDRQEQAYSHLSSQFERLLRDRDQLACDLDNAQYSLRESLDRENILKARGEELESHLAAARSDLEEVRTEVEKLRAELENTTPEPCLEISTPAEDNQTSTAAPTNLEYDEASESVVPIGTEPEPEPLPAEAAAASTEEEVIAQSHAAEPSADISSPEAQGFGTILPEELRDAIFPDAASRVIVKRACLDLDSQNIATRSSAAKALGGVRHELSVKVLSAHLVRESSPRVRQECVKALTSLEMEQGLLAMRLALSDSASSVRLAAVKGMYRLGGIKVAAAIAEMLTDGDEEIRRRAATCIGWLGGETHVAALLPLLEDGSASVRHTAIEAMSNLRSLLSVSPLIECLNDPEESIRRAASVALEIITGKKMSDSYPTDAASHGRLIARWRAWWRDDKLCLPTVLMSEDR